MHIYEIERFFFLIALNIALCVTSDETVLLIV